MLKYLALLILLIPPLVAEESENDNESAENKWDRVAIFGDSRGELGEPSGLNEDILGKLLKLIQIQEVKAVFSTGDMVLGIGKKNHETPSPENLMAPAPEKDIYGNRWAKKGYVYSTEIFRKQLQAFSQLYKEKLGNTPFYPLIGYDEALGPDSLLIFKDHFGLKNVQIIDHYLVYSVTIGNASFIMLSTNYYDMGQKKIKEHVLSIPVLEWLSRELKEKAKTSPFLFVLGHEPAFSTTAPSGDYRGLDQEPFLRDVFWHLLQDNGVLAYICSDEHLYDRTDRQGVWQIISGGGGAPLTKRNLEKAFFHFLLMNIPVDAEENPVIDVLDVNGRIRDSFELKTNRRPIYQLRISKE